MSTFGLVVLSEIHLSENFWTQWRGERNAPPPVSLLVLPSLFIFWGLVYLNTSTFSQTSRKEKQANKQMKQTHSPMAARSQVGPSPASHPHLETGAGCLLYMAYHHHDLKGRMKEILRCPLTLFLPCVFYTGKHPYTCILIFLKLIHLINNCDGLALANQSWYWPIKSGPGPLCQAFPLFLLIRGGGAGLGGGKVHGLGGWMGRGKAHMTVTIY